MLLEPKLVDADGKTHPIKIGVIGFVPPQIMQWDKTHLEGRVVVRDIVATARRYVPKMRAKGAQLVIAIPHASLERVMAKSGSGELAENEVGQLSMVPGIDVICSAIRMPSFRARTSPTARTSTSPAARSTACRP